MIQGLLRKRKYAHVVVRDRYWYGYGDLGVRFWRASPSGKGKPNPIRAEMLIGKLSDLILVIRRLSGWI